MLLTDTERNDLLIELEEWHALWDPLVSNMTGVCAAAYAASVAFVNQARALALQATAGADGIFDIPELEGALDGFEDVSHGLDGCNVRHISVTTVGVIVGILGLTLFALTYWRGRQQA